mmetsp:Transcript_28182/g.74409  ORF Transcript_28182/g.74409 Transcript_28182/m.74409 type:complete len:405 (+) Transcript_28182:1209-2423(+)
MELPGEAAGAHEVLQRGGALRRLPPVGPAHPGGLQRQDAPHEPGHGRHPPPQGVCDQDVQGVPLLARRAALRGRQRQHHQRLRHVHVRERRQPARAQRQGAEHLLVGRRQPHGHVRHGRGGVRVDGQGRQAHRRLRPQVVQLHVGGVRGGGAVHLLRGDGPAAQGDRRLQPRARAGRGRHAAHAGLPVQRRPRPLHGVGHGGGAGLVVPADGRVHGAAVPLAGHHAHGHLAGRQHAHHRGRRWPRHAPRHPGEGGAGDEAGPGAAALRGGDPRDQVGPRGEDQPDQRAAAEGGGAADAERLPAQAQGHDPLRQDQGAAGQGPAGHGGGEAAVRGPAGGQVGPGARVRGAAQVDRGPARAAAAADGGHVQPKDHGRGRAVPAAGGGEGAAQRAVGRAELHPRRVA